MSTKKTDGTKQSPWWSCSGCGFDNKPHAYRRGDANEKCEQCGKQRDEDDLDRGAK